MAHPRYLSFTLLLSMALPGGVRAQAVDTASIDALLKEALQSWKAPGVAVVIVRGDKVLYLKGHGVRDLATKKPVTADTVFPLASCSKAFTTTALAMLVDEGKISWDDPVRKHIEFFRLADPLADANVTIRDLVCHRTGINSHDLLWYRNLSSPEETLRKLAHVKPTRSFRSAFHYQSSMFTAAGHAVGMASKSSWGDFVQKRIFDPLDMTSARLTTRETLKTADHASPHKKSPAGKVEVVPWYPFEHPEPAGSITLSARDLGKWLMFQLGDGTVRGKRLVSAANLAETHTAQFPLRVEGFTRAVNPFTFQMSYGMAWVIQDYRGFLMWSHAGAIDGFRAHITLLPQANLGIGVVSNLDATRMNNAVSSSLVDLVLGLPYNDWNAHFTKLVQLEEDARKQEFQQLQDKRNKGTKPSHDLQAYVGTYEEPAYGTARVFLDKDRLMWEWSSFRLPLEHYHYDSFLLRQDNLFGLRSLVFTLGQDGEVAGMKVLDVEFKKKK